MSELQDELLPAFVSWASRCQRKLLEAGSPFVTNLQVGPATGKRAVGLSVEKFRVEATGWITKEVEEGGDLWLWESGEADAQWATADELMSDPPVVGYLEHWDNLTPQQFELAFSHFTKKFEVAS